MTIALERPAASGSIDFNGFGIAGCVECGWRGVPTFLGGRRQAECPACGVRETHEVEGYIGTGRGYVLALCLRHYPYGLRVLRWLEDTRRGWIFRPSMLPLAEVIPLPKVGRNEPCTCGSGRKFKKCCGAAA